MKISKLWFMLVAALLAVAVTSCSTTRSSEVTMNGMMVCGKCKLHMTSQCQNVLQVQENGQTVNYFLAQNKVSKAFHSNICQTDGEQVTVTGTVKEKDGHECLTATSIVPAGGSM